MSKVIAVLVVVFVVVFSSAAIASDTHPTTGYVCTPHGVAKGWAIQYNAQTGAAIKFVRMHARFAKGWCISYVDGHPQAFVRYTPRRAS